MTKRAKYFSASEFRRCTPPCSIEDMDSGFLAVLDKVRAEAGIPLLLSCAYRSREWDLQRGRSGRSAHCMGMAVDIVCNQSQTRYKILRAAIACGITRIGIGSTFIHIDTGDRTGQLPPQVVWHYYD